MGPPGAADEGTELLSQFFEIAQPKGGVPPRPLLPTAELKGPFPAPSVQPLLAPLNRRLPYGSRGGHGAGKLGEPECPGA